MRVLVVIGLLWSEAVFAQDVTLRYNTYGMAGLIDMPTAFSAPDAELAFTVSGYADQIRSTATFQLTPRFSASFRYAALDNVLGQNDIVFDQVFDRSFALQYRFVDETAHRPAIAVGVSDFAGTGIYSSEYFVASKTLHPNIAATVGVGWGRLAGVGGFDNPFGLSNRPERDFAQGGTVTKNSFFRGDAAFFGGLAWQVSPRFDVVLEYSSDALPFEDGGAFDRRSPLNVGLTYRPRPSLQLSGQYLYGREIAAQLTYVINPTSSPLGTGFDPGPPPVVPANGGRRSAIADALQAEGLRLYAITRRDDVLHVEVENLRYLASAQAVGRTARVLAQSADADVSHFAITLTSQGLAGTTVTVSRADLVRFEFAVDGDAQMLRRATFTQPIERFPPVLQNFYDWSLGPFVTANVFDPDDPLRADFGAQLDASWSPTPGVVLAGTLRQRLFGNLDQATRMSDTVLPRVRSDFALYDREGDVDIIDLTVAWFGQLTSDVTMRITAGLLEEMFGGVSAEVLWRPDNQPFAFGIDVNQVRQRDFDSGFEFLDYEVTTGHASLYWDMGRGYEGRVDAGRYLAGDWGGTFTMTRRFRNGWSLGVFATFTDVPFEEFGEGSFDKGINISIPVAWLSGRPTRDTVDRTIRPVTRDGGARLQVRDRLYDLTRPLQTDAVTDSWGRLWS